MPTHRLSVTYDFNLKCHLYASVPAGQLKILLGANQCLQRGFMKCLKSHHIQTPKISLSIASHRLDLKLPPSKLETRLKLHTLHFCTIC